VHVIIKEKHVSHVEVNSLMNENNYW